MSHVAELLASLCPAGVEHRPLGDLGEFIRGRRFTKADYVESGLGSIHYGEIYTDFGTSASSVHRYVRPELKNSLRLARPGDLVVAATGENVDDVCKAVAWLGDEEVAVHDDCYIFRHDLDPTFVSYFFQSARFNEQKTRLASESKLARVSGANLAKIIAPAPPLEVQREVVRVLNEFATLQAQLEAELKAELEARRRQYDHYRDSLLTFERERERERVRWLPMSELGALFGGLTGKTKSDFADGNARFVSYKNVLNNIAVVLDRDDRVRVDPGERQRRLERGDVLFTGSSETAGEVAMSSVVTRAPTEPIYLNSFTIGFRPNDASMFDPEFTKHLFRSSEMRKKLVATASGVTRFNVSKARLAKIQVPIPTHETQVRIAAVLGRFDGLVDGLSISLRQELRARRQQYEYYRDRLLTFEERAA